MLPREDVRAVLASTDILVQPGRADSFNDYRFPSKLPEFFASRKPVILPRTNLGLAVRDWSGALLTGIRGLDRDCTEGRTANGRSSPRVASWRRRKDFAIQRLSWRTNVAPLPDFYAHILGGRRGRMEAEQQATAESRFTCHSSTRSYGSLGPQPSSNLDGTFSHAIILKCWSRKRCSF